jgi:hypothetical protein
MKLRGQHGIGTEKKGFYHNFLCSYKSIVHPEFLQLKFSPFYLSEDVLMSFFCTASSGNVFAIR